MRVMIAIGLALAATAAAPVCAAPACCKVCRAGKPCGDSCIARDSVCRKGPGCACSG